MLGADLHASETETKFTTESATRLVTVLSPPATVPAAITIWLRLSKLVTSTTWPVSVGVSSRRISKFEMWSLILPMAAATPKVMRSVSPISVEWLSSVVDADAAIERAALEGAGAKNARLVAPTPRSMIPCRPRPALVPASSPTVPSFDMCCRTPRLPKRMNSRPRHRCRVGAHADVAAVKRNASLPPAVTRIESSSGVSKVSRPWLPPPMIGGHHVIEWLAPERWWSTFGHVPLQCVSRSPSQI